MSKADDTLIPKGARMAPGQRYGRLVSVWFVDIHKGHRRWLFRCDCGNESIAHALNVRRGATRSCGCLEHETRVANCATGRTKHGRARTLEYRTWISMNRRCADPTRPDYPRYGGRGIKVCERWRNSFETFFADMGERPSIKHSIDRIDHDGHYEPGNCRWALGKTQQRNLSSNRRVLYEGQEMTLAEACECAGRLADYDAIYMRVIKCGWSLEKALTKPIRVARPSLRAR